MSSAASETAWVDRRLRASARERRVFGLDLRWAEGEEADGLAAEEEEAGREEDDEGVGAGDVGWRALRGVIAVRRTGERARGVDDDVGGGVDRPTEDESRRRSSTGRIEKYDRADVLPPSEADPLAVEAEDERERASDGRRKDEAEEDEGVEGEGGSTGSLLALVSWALGAGNWRSGRVGRARAGDAASEGEAGGQPHGRASEPRGKG